jgi:hypothetical protein
MTEIVVRHRRGMQFLKARRKLIAAGAAQQPPAWSDLCKLERDHSARALRTKLAEKLQVSEKVILDDAKLAAAVEEICANCGPAARKVLLGGARPQAAQAILRLSRTADARQQYRVEGVLQGRFKSVAPQNDDPVFDTVGFHEVPSRLCRARGAIQMLQCGLQENNDPLVHDECIRLAALCRRSSLTLRRFVGSRRGTKVAIPSGPSRDHIGPVLKGRLVRGKLVGMARLAVRLTIKSVWDYPEMQRRGIAPSGTERTKVRQELGLIVAAANGIEGQEDVRRNPPP